MAAKRIDDDDRTTATGLARYAVEYFSAASLLSSRNGFNEPASQLLGTAIELALKACLRAKGMNVADIRTKFGHDLTKLLNEVEGQQSVLIADDSALLTLFNKHYADRYFVYIQTGSCKVPQPDEILRIAGILLGVMFDRVKRAQGFLRPGYPAYEWARPHLPDRWKTYQWLPSP